MSKIEGWYDRDDDFHEGFDWEVWHTDRASYADLNRFVVNFDVESEKGEYKTLWSEDWAEYYDDEEAFWDAVDDWYASEYGEAVG